MNKIIREQLEKVRTLRIKFSDSDTFIKIDKVTNIPTSSIVPGQSYMFSIAGGLNTSFGVFSTFTGDVLDVNNNILTLALCALDDTGVPTRVTWFGDVDISRVSVIKKL